jgi:hypothetical protein
MPRFRPARGIPEPLNAAAVRRVIADAWRPSCFFVGPSLTLEWEPVEREEGAWEIFQGRLLDPAHTRKRRTFETWNVHALTADGRSGEPLLSVKLDAAAGELFVVRGLEVYAWEGYDSGGGVILSRERRKWTRELVGEIRLEDFADADELRDELICLLFHAVVGAGRLPLTSVEAPLPAFSFGELLYCYRDVATAGPMRTGRDLTPLVADPRLNRLERVKALETLLHAAPPDAMREIASDLAAHGVAAESPGLLRTLFNEASLSPCTDLVDKTLAFLEVLPEDEAVDFLGWLLRTQGRHLTAYDLVVFHHRGANYPDALLLDAVLKAYLARIEGTPALFLSETADDASVQRQKRLRRRALRQGWLVRRRYEGWPVPDLPTSPGENARVLPPSHPRVPEEQILQPAKRTRRLYDGDPLTDHVGPHAKAALRQSVADLERDEELCELGTAIFLDRPFGDAKAPTEPDGTLLLASEALGRSIAEERLRALAREPGLLTEAEFTERLRRLREGAGVVGLPLDAVGGSSRPGVVSLADARRAAPDFVFLRTMPGSVRALLERFDFGPLAERFDLHRLLGGERVLVAGDATGSGILVYDASMRPRLDLRVRAEDGFVRRAGREYPAGGLTAVCVWEETAGDLRMHNLRAAPAVLAPL